MQQAGRAEVVYAQAMRASHEEILGVASADYDRDQEHVTGEY